MAKKNVAGALVGTAIKGGLGFALSRGKVDPITGILTTPTTADRFRTAARLTIPAFAAEDRFQAEEQQLGIAREGLAESRAQTNISAFEAESQDKLRQAQIGQVKQKAEQEANLDKRFDFDSILPKGLKGDSFLIPEVKDLLTSMGAVLNKDGEITARTFKELNDTDEGRQSFQRGMKGIIERRLGNLDKSESILKGSIKNQLDKFNEANATNITLDDLRSPEIREQIGDSKLLEQSKNLQGIQQKREIFRGARDKLDDILVEKTSTRKTAFIPNEEGTFTMGFTDGLTGSFEPIKGDDGLPVKLTEKQVLLSQGKRAESLVDPFKVGFDTSAGREAGKLKIELETQIIKATQSNQTIQRGLDLLDSESGTFSGPLANIKVGFNKYLKEFGLNLTGEQVPNTEAFAAVMARDVINILGSGDLGVGTGISDNDRIFAAKIVGGDVTLDKNSIRKLLELNTKVNNAKITINNRRLESLQTQREASNPFAGQTPSPTVNKTSFNELPNPAGFNGKIMTDTDTGERFKSDGSSWRLIE